MSRYACTRSYIITCLLRYSPYFLILSESYLNQVIVIACYVMVAARIEPLGMMQLSGSTTYLIAAVTQLNVFSSAFYSKLSSLATTKKRQKTENI